ncbi:Acetate operon repressor [Shimia sp. SK013]|uniref:helix-turn-helix domain-containing protein n=1 Tax=Shimia sp. SK013 TaxID=1389006 RepID=UPI0006B4F2BF|nr:helix-turn-helix domain-containing protein [Shimia sp. SK013]KPA21647.1 Acetate operon repressor [Shimia sp. SK013]
MTDLEGPKRIRALDRGLSVVEHLSNSGLSTLADLRAATGLSNATLLRNLATLQDRGWVRRNIVEGHYELAHSLGEVLGANARAHPLAEIAAPILLEMKGRQLGFPSDLCALIGPGKMEIVESTRIRGPMAPGRTSLGIRPSMLRSAHGRAFLAFSSREVRDFHVQIIRLQDLKENRPWVEAARLDEELEKTRQRGYGLRDADYFLHYAFDPGPDISAIAVPILSRSGIHGTLSILWLREDTTLQEVLALDSLNDMRKAASRIGAAMDKHGIKAPVFATTG